jgi:hypothetical protein
MFQFRALFDICLFFADQCENIFETEVVCVLAKHDVGSVMHKHNAVKISRGQ